MESRTGQVRAFHDLTYNCAQSVACTYTDLVGADRETVFRLCEAYGGGLACGKGTCGALLGACAIAGLANSDGNLEQPASKRSTYEIVARLFKGFEQSVGSSVCCEIRGTETGTPLSTCDKAMEVAAKLVEDEFFS